MDTLEHFSNYESAADDVLTVKKWQEMDIPILKGPAVDYALLSHSYGSKKSVFDNAEKGEDYKWRYSGPYLPDMPAGDFKRYIKNKIKPRREEFIKFVARYQHIYAIDYQSTSHSGESYYGRGLEDESPMQQRRKAMEESPDEKVPGEIDPDKVDILALRADSFLLEHLVLAFLDIPFYSRPHRTHPSGGLHYTRSSAHLRNDPVEGLQSGPKPVPGRLMNYSPSTGGLVGVGGIVAKATDAGRLDEAIRTHNDRSRTRKFLPGIAKLDALGRVLLDVDTVSETPGYRSIYGGDGSGEGGESTRMLLKNMIGNSRSYGGLYNAGDEVGASPGPRVSGVVGANPGKSHQSDDVMELLMSRSIIPRRSGA